MVGAVFGTRYVCVCVCVCVRDVLLSYTVSSVCTTHQNGPSPVKTGRLHSPSWRLPFRSSTGDQWKFAVILCGSVWVTSYTSFHYAYLIKRLSFHMRTDDLQHEVNSTLTCNLRGLRIPTYQRVKYSCCALRDEPTVSCRDKHRLQLPKRPFSPLFISVIYYYFRHTFWT